MTSSTETPQERVARLTRAYPQFVVPHGSWFAQPSGTLRTDGRAIQFGRRFRKQNAEKIRDAIGQQRDLGHEPVRHAIFVPSDEIQEELFADRIGGATSLVGAYTIQVDGPDLVLFQLVVFAHEIDPEVVIVSKHRGAVLLAKSSRLSAWDGGVPRSAPTPVVDAHRGDLVTIVNVIVPGED